jgi:hypothetical protein
MDTGRLFVFEGQMSLRNQNNELIPSSSLAINSRLPVYVSCKTYMDKKKYVWKVQFEMEWVRKLKEIEKMLK